MKKLLSALLALALIFSISGSSFSAYAATQTAKKKSSSQASRDYRENVVDSSLLFYKNGVIFWGYENSLCSALLDEDGIPYDYLSEGRLSSDVSYIALDEDHIYMATEDGLVRLSMEESAQDKSYMKVLDDHDLSHGFQMDEEDIFFLYGSSLYKLPKEGGESKVLEKDIECFQLTDAGVYCLNGEGALILVSLDGKERKTLAELDSQGQLGIFLDKAYITTGDDDDYIYVYDLGQDSWEELDLEEDISPYSPVWVTGDSLYYKADKGQLHLIDLQTGKDSQCPNSLSLPDYDEGFLLWNMIYYKLAERLFWMEPEGNLSQDIEIDKALSSGASASASGDYDIAQDISLRSSQGLARLETAYFTLYLPSGTGLEYSVHGKNSIGIYYGPAREAGYGGNLVTITAYDLDDDSYKDLPHYTVAGSDGSKRYIAMFPTDLQYSPETETGYREMLEYLLEIDQNNADSPFFCG